MHNIKICRKVDLLIKVSDYALVIGNQIQSRTDPKSVQRLFMFDLQVRRGFINFIVLHLSVHIFDSHQIRPHGDCYL